MRVRELPDPDHLPALDPRYAIERPALDLGPLDHPPRILLLYASLRARGSVVEDAARLLQKRCRQEKGVFNDISGKSMLRSWKPGRGSAQSKRRRKRGAHNFDPHGNSP
jgi:hypothetical protein